MISAADLEASQRVTFCTSSDGVRIAYATHGRGPALVLNSCWLSHLNYDWRSPVWRHYLVELGRIATVIRYDERGHGLSDRHVTDFSLERRIDDLSAVVEHAGLDRFALIAMAQGGPTAVSYVVRNPGRVTRLIGLNTAAAPASGLSPDAAEMEAALKAMILAGWDLKDPLFRRVFTSMLIPGATEEQMSWVDDLHQSAVTARTAHAYRVARAEDDVTALLGQIDVPTLVLQSRFERMDGFTDGRTLAAGIPRAKFVPLDSANHILLGDEPAWAVFLREVADFLAEDGPPPAVDHDLTALSARELEVLRAAAEGLDNPALAARFHLSVRTVERHLQSSYQKLGVSGPTARAAAVARVVAQDAQR